MFMIGCMPIVDCIIGRTCWAPMSICGCCCIGWLNWPSGALPISPWVGGPFIGLRFIICTDCPLIWSRIWGAWFWLESSGAVCAIKGLTGCIISGGGPCRPVIPPEAPPVRVCVPPAPILIVPMFRHPSLVSKAWKIRWLRLKLWVTQIWS